MNTLAKVAGLFLLCICFAFATPSAKKIIVIDAGHGGDDHGVTHDELTEKELVQSIASKIKESINENNVEIVLLREDDHFMSLNDRVAKINALRPDLLISLHINYSQNKNDNGISAFVSKSSAHYSTSIEKAENLVNELAGSSLAKKEVKQASLFVLNNSNCPGFLLELGYLTNEKDREYISSEAGQRAIAGKIVEYLQR